MVEVSVIATFIAGILSFLSPCVLPIIPGFLAYLTGSSLKELKEHRLDTFVNSVFFVFGFSLVFSIMGVLLNTVLESVSYQLQAWLSRLGGIIIIAFGLYLVGLLKLSFLDQERKIHVKKKFDIKYLTSFVFGASFAVGWSPCVGVILGSVLALTISQPGLGFILLLSYSLGLGIPFLLVGLFSTQALSLIKKLGKYLKYFNIVVGIFLIILGILVFTQTLNYVANFGILNNLLLE